MKILFKSALLAAVAASVMLSSANLMAQPQGGQGQGRGQGRGQGQDQGFGQGQGGGGRQRGNFDPAQMQQMMMERYKEMLEFTDETEWKAISPLIEKVTTARTESMMGMMGRGGRGGRGGGMGGMGGFQAPEQTGAMAKLQRALDAKAGSAEIKAILVDLSTETKAKEAALIKTQEDLRAVLTARQEGLAVVGGLLPPQTK